MSDLNLTKLKRYALKGLRDAGLPTPEPLPPIEEAQQFPLDLTRLHNVNLRKQMSFWKAQLGRAEYVLAMSQANELGLKEAVSDRERRFQIINQGQYKTKWESEAALSEDSSYSELDNKYQVARAKTILVKGIVKTYEHYWDSLSRELAARIADMERESRDRPQ